MKLTYGILSTATITQRFIKAVQAVGDEVGAIASRSIKKAEQAAKEHNIKQAYGSYEELYADPAIDLIYIATNHASHAEEITAALRSGKHVVCEKPLTLTKAEAVAVFALARQQNRFLMEAQKSVFLPVTLAVQALIKEETLGRLHQIEMSSSFPYPAAAWMHDPHQGGVILGSASYTIEYLDVLCNPKRVQAAALGILEATGACERVSMNFLMDDVLVNSRISMHGDTKQHALFYFDHGYVEVPFYWKARSYSIYTEKGCQTYEHPVTYEMMYEAAHVHACIAQGSIISNIMTPQRTISCCGIVDDFLKQVGQRG